jgi:hypothetical protein
LRIFLNFEKNVEKIFEKNVEKILKNCF